MQISSSARGTLACVVICLLALLPGLGSGAHAAAAQSSSLRVIANGMPVALAGHALIQNGVIMAPYQGLFEPLGIRATWNPQDRSLSLISPAGDEMILRAGDPYVSVNGERRPVPIPLVAVFDRVLVPIQWVFETLGDVTAYDPGDGVLVISPQITGISWRGTDAGLEVTIDATGPLRPKSTLLHNPARIVVDLPGAAPKSMDQNLDVHEGPLKAIRVSRSGSSTRVVFDLSAPVDYRLSGGPARRVVVALNTHPTAPPAAPPTYQPSARKISDVAYEHADGGGRVVVVANGPVQVSQRVLKNPDRVVVDIADAVFLPVKKSLDVDDGLVVQVRAAQFQRSPNVVRIVIELTRPSPSAVRPGQEAGQLFVEVGAAARPGRPAATGPRGPVVVAVDAGHGGSDPGAIGPAGTKEKDVALAIAQALRRLLTQQHLDVVMTREADVFVPLEDRSQIASRGGATLFVSIHANASTDPNASGLQTFYAAPTSQPLAQTVMEEAARGGGLAPRGTTQASFKVLVDTSHIPSILVEAGFITNDREEQILRDPQRQQALAQGIMKGIQRFLAMPQATVP